MQNREFANLKRRAEAPPGQADPEAPRGPRVRRRDTPTAAIAGRRA